MKFGNRAAVSAPGGGGKSKKTLRIPPGNPPSPPPPPPEAEIPSPEMITFASDWQALVEPTHAMMGADADHRREMVSLTEDVAPRADCTYVAVQNGNWTAATTWLRVSDNAFAVPVAGAKIGIPSGITVTYNGNATTAYDYIRVDGVFQVATGQNTLIHYNTMVVHHTGEYIQGTSATPITSSFTSETVFTDPGNIDTTVDPLWIGRGLITMTDTTIHGAEKTHYGTTSQTRSIGDTTITLDAAPTGWAEGDKLYIAGTNIGGWVRLGNGFNQIPYSGDEVEIVSVAGATITFTPALANARAVPVKTDFEDIKYHVVNRTRNIVFRSPDGTPVYRRGHIMFMHGAIDVRWAEARNLGRTQKGDAGVVDNFNATDDAARITIEGADVPWGTNSGAANVNLRGRYHWHVHRAGLESDVPFAELVGLTAHDAPGWGIAHHQSRANIRKCCVVAFKGAGIMAETGGEAGVWEDNFVGYTTYTGTAGNVAQQKALNISGNNDLGRFGDGYWMAGRAVILRRNVACDCRKGFFWMSRFIGATAVPNIDDTPEPRASYSSPFAGGSLPSGERPVIHDFRENIVYNCEYGSLVVKFTASQGHNYRSVFVDFLGWNVTIGNHFEYSGHYTVKNSRILYAPNLGSFFAPAIFINGSAFDIVIEGLIARHAGAALLSTGVLFEGGTPGVRAPTADNAITVIEPIVMDDGRPKFKADNLAVGFEDAFELITMDDVTIAEPYFEFDEEPVWPNYSITSAGQACLIVDGPITTETGTRSRSKEPIPEAGSIVEEGLHSIIPDIRLHLAQYGYFTYSGSNYALVPDLIARRLLDVNGDIQIRYLTLVVKINTTLPPGYSINYANYTPRGALPTRYVDAILIGLGTPPGTPDPNAGKWVVYEDALGAGGIHEGR